MPRTVLSEEDEQAEADGRERMHALRGKIRELRGRREQLLKEVQRLSDEQRTIYESRRPKQEAVERAHDRHRAIGRELDRLRSKREAARRALDESVAAARMARPARRREAPVRPDQIRREMAELERRQQTVALPLADENALIDRMRLLRKQLGEAEREVAGWEAQEAKTRELDEEVRRRHQELDALGEEMGRLRRERDATMESIRTQLIDLGQVVAQLREKAVARRQAYETLVATSRQLNDVEREADRIDRESRHRRHEARRTVVEYNRDVREKVGADAGYERAAEEQLQELMKRGRVTLSG